MNHTEFHKRIFLLLLGIITLTFFAILLPFYSAIFWSFILAVLFFPVHRFLLKKTKQRAGLSAFITLMICLIIVILPVAFLALYLIKEGLAFYETAQTHLTHIDIYLQEIFTSMPGWMVEFLNFLGIKDPSDIQGKISTAVIKGGQNIASHILIISQNIFNFVISFLITLYLLFFLIRDGIQLSDRIEKIIPLNNSQKHQLLKKFMSVVRATVKGNLLISLMQGALGGLIFWILGINNPLLWGAVMAILSLLPSGSCVVWFPVAIYFFATGSIAKGLILIGFGIFIIGVFDNILRPVLVGKDTQMPDYLIFISTVGGLVLFGLNGFVIGPTIAALFITSWDLFSLITESPNGEDTSPS